MFNSSQAFVISSLPARYHHHGLSAGKLVPHRARLYNAAMQHFLVRFSEPVEFLNSFALYPCGEREWANVTTPEQVTVRGTYTYNTSRVERYGNDLLGLLGLCARTQWDGS
jgi:hypothetical protein